MNQQQISQSFHDIFTEAAKEWSEELAGKAPPEEVLRGLMQGAASFTAATWAASSRASGVDLPLTKVTMQAALDNFWGQAVIPQTMRA